MSNVTKMTVHQKSMIFIFHSFCLFFIIFYLIQVPGQNEETLELLNLPPDRIGHGTFLHPNLGGTQHLVDTIEKLRIPMGG